MLIMTYCLTFMTSLWFICYFCFAWGLMHSAKWLKLSRAWIIPCDSDISLLLVLSCDTVILTTCIISLLWVLKSFLSWILSASVIGQGSTTSAILYNYCNSRCYWAKHISRIFIIKSNFEEGSQGVDCDT